jgi:filamentous hemagglutinin
LLASIIGDGDVALKALYGVKAAQDMWVAGSGAASVAGGAAGGDMNAVRVELNIGSSKSTSTSELKQNEVRGSTLTAGGNVNMVATGQSGTSGDLHITGSGITGNNVTLVAQNDLLLDAASNNREQKSANNSSGWAAGVHVSVGKETGIGVQASGYQSKGGDDGKTTEYVNTRVNARDELSMSSGRDTVIAGAQALGDKITADVGRDLLVSSLQDTDDYTSWQKNVSGGASFTFGSMSGSASLSISNSKTKSEYASVGEQSGLFAGDKGFDITVGRHTQLDGAVIASTATADKNALDTGTLGWRDINNSAEYSSDSKGIIGGYAGDKNGSGGGAIPIIGIGAHDDASGTTHSAIADGTITVRDKENQQQDVASLSRDTDNANGHIDKIFDKEKVQEQQELAGLFGQMANQAAGDVGAAMGWGEYSAEKAAIHGVIGALQASLGGGNALAGGMAGLSSEAFGKMVMDYLGSHTSLGESEKGAIVQWAAAVSGAAVGGVIAGTNGAQSGAAASVDSVRWNSLAHVLAAAEANKSGTAEKWQAEQQAAIEEACKGGTPISCETAVAAMGSAMAWPLLPGVAATTSLIGAGANAGIGMLINGEVNPNDVILAYWTGALTSGTGLWGTIAVNAGGGAASSYLKGDDPLKGGVISGAASGLGYGVGKLTQGQLDKVFNPNWKNWEWVDVGMGISKPMPLDPLPGITGNVIGSGATEFTNDQVGKKIDEIGGKK